MADYNEVYDKLVESDVDFVGLIAYGLYKRGKRKHIIDFIEKKNKRPTNKDIDAYVNMALGQLDIYKAQAEQVFSKVTAAEVRKELERSHEHQKLVELVVKEAKEELNKVEENYQDAVDQSIKTHTFSLWETVGVNILSAIILPFVVYVIILLICLIFPTFPDLAKEMIKSLGNI